MESENVTKKIKIKLRSISKVFTTRSRQIVALENINVDIYDRELVCLMGPSGCGKSTLLNIIACLMTQDEGKVLVDGHGVNTAGADRAVVFQSDAVFPWMTVKENIAYGLKMSRKPKEEIEQTVNHFIQLIHLGEFRDAWPKELSGGMKKRVDVARAYANDPEILLMDEPFGALDIMTKEQLQLDLEELWIQNPKTIVFVTHDIEEALFLGDRVVVMTPRPGRIDNIYVVPFERPRTSDLKTSMEFVNLRRRILKTFSEKASTS